MKTKKNLALFALTLGATAVLAACGGSKSDSSQASSQNAGSSDNFKAVMVSDTGGIDDKSFNQGAWEGLQEWGKNNGGKTKGNGIDYILSKSESDYNTILFSQSDLNYKKLLKKQQKQIQMHTLRLSIVWLNNQTLLQSTTKTKKQHSLLGLQLV